VSELYIGLMSGTSLDGVDGVLADFSNSSPRVVAFSTAPFPQSLREELLALNTAGNNELHRAALAANALMRLYASVVQQLLHQSRLAPKDVRAVGAHGQTVRHRPQEFDGTGYTLQLNQPSLLAELCGIDVVADFRSRDLAAGGQGAPLVPPFHQQFFGHPDQMRAILNIGGISNLTLIDPANPGQLLGFDCGPGNTLMDAWCLQHTGASFDDGGQWAARGQVNPALLRRLLAEPYFSRPAPKSTGRDLFNPEWQAAALAQCAPVSAADVQATLAELTARCCIDSLLACAPACEQLIVCGGGALNRHLIQRLQALLPQSKVSSSAEHGLPPLQVEATAFAWLARQAVHRLPASLPGVTGARGPRILGGIYPA
jgi:anhydro-N-acetylmuramic acid kinase